MLESVKEDVNHVKKDLKVYLNVAVSFYYVKPFVGELVNDE